MRDGVALLTWRTDTFAYAESYDEAASRYRGLHGGHGVNVSSDSTGLARQAGRGEQAVGRRSVLAQERRRPANRDRRGGTPYSQPRSWRIRAQPSARPALRRFHGSVRVDSTRVGRDAGRIADEVIAHLAGQMGAEVTVTIEIEARLPNGAAISSCAP